MINKALALLGAMMALLGLSSCLEMESTISVSQDGSGIVTERIAMGAQMTAMMKMGGAEGGEDPFAQFDEAALKEKESRFGEGVTFDSVKQEEKDGGMVFTVTYKFADVSKLTYEPGLLMDNEEAEEEAEEEKGEELKFEFADGELTVLVPEPDASDFALEDEEMSEEQLVMMAPMMAGLKMSVKLQFEGGIESTNATYTEGNSVTLMSLDFDGLMKNEGGLAAMKKLQVDGREEFAEAVKGVQGVEAEHQAKVSVKLK